MKREGHVKEEIYDRLCLVKDTNYVKEKANKPDSISQKMRHRVDILR